MAVLPAPQLLWRNALVARPRELNPHPVAAILIPRCSVVADFADLGMREWKASLACPLALALMSLVLSHW